MMGDPPKGSSINKRKKPLYAFFDPKFGLIPNLETIFDILNINTNTGGDIFVSP